MVTRKANPKLSAKFFPKHKLEKIDTIRDNEGSFRKNHTVLMDAYNAWAGLDEFRKNSERNKMYTFEDQWGDKVQTKKGWVTERKNILNQGSIPLTNNRIRGIVRSVVGVFQGTQTEPVCTSRTRDEQGKGEMMSATLQYNYQLNKLWGLDSANLNYFLVTGLAAFKSTFGWRNGKMDVWTDIVNYNRIFFDNHMEDHRHWDCHLIGEIHDVGLYDVMAQFSDGSREKSDRIREMYSYCDKERTVSYLQNLTRNRVDVNFFTAQDETRCRVIEIWKKEAKERLLVHDTLTGDFYKAEVEEAAVLDAENKARLQEQAMNGVLPEDMKLINYQWFIDNYWYYYYMSPHGDVLKEGETPFWHESHPYSFRVYPFFDKKVYPFVGDFIDQQRYINRLITLQDFVIRATAKGVLAIDEESIPDGYTINDIAEEWSVFNGVILYTSKKNPAVKLPQQIVANATQLGLTDLLSIQLKLLEDISGVQGALQGKAPNAGTPAALYAQQVQNSTTSLTEIYEAYRELREERDYKNMKLIQQSYPEPRYININSGKVRSESIVYDPKLVRNAEFDLSITESTSTPAYRMIINDFLMQLFGTGQITLQELLENGAFPFADKLLQSFNTRMQEQQDAQAAMMGGVQPAGQMGQGFVPEDIGQQINQNTNPIVQRMSNN